MPSYLVGEKGHTPMKVPAQYESAAATNYVSAAAKGELYTVRRVHVRKLIGGLPLGRRFVFDVVDTGVVCQAFKPQRCPEDALELARMGVLEGAKALRQLAVQLGVQGVEGMTYQELIEAVSNLVPEDGSSMTVKKDPK